MAALAAELAAFAANAVLAGAGGAAIMAVVLGPCAIAARPIAKLLLINSYFTVPLQHSITSSCSVPLNFCVAVLILGSPLDGIPCSAAVTEVGRAATRGIILAVDVAAVTDCELEPAVAAAAIALLESQEQSPLQASRSPPFLMYLTLEQ